MVPEAPASITYHHNIPLMPPLITKLFPWSVGFALDPAQRAYRAVGRRRRSQATPRPAPPTTAAVHESSSGCVVIIVDISRLMKSGLVFSCGSAAGAGRGAPAPGGGAQCGASGPSRACATPHHRAPTPPQRARGRLPLHSATRVHPPPPRAHLAPLL
ncbi:hypothetical protein EVAR_23896_1 [Eumeta japonica]|uniref:Uncharacterized protein n=1 Tax=Eumeta variegata TaxID=151549 RepID=A0A4C1V3U7_EUMVA|nr:hypothetical protein EVAR_23896_1 [Eumeta japonica]